MKILLRPCFIYFIQLVGIVLATFLMHPNAQAENATANKTQRIQLPIYTEEFPPYNYALNGQVTGINIKILKAACDDAKIDCEFTIFPWNRAMRTVQETVPSGLVSTARTDEREHSFKWVGPLVSGQSCLYKLSSNNTVNVETTKDLLKYKLGVTNESPYLNVLNNMGFVEGENIVFFPEKMSRIKPFAYNRVDLIIGGAGTVKKQIATADLTIEDIVPVYALNSSFAKGNYLALHPDTSDVLRDLLQESVQKIMLKKGHSQSKTTKDDHIEEPHFGTEDLWKICLQ